MGTLTKTTFAKTTKMMLSPFRSWLWDDWPVFEHVGSVRSPHSRAVTTSTPHSRLSFDVSEKDTAYEVVAHLPVPRDKVKLSIKDGNVTISGSDEHSSTKEVDGFTCSQSSFSSFSRSFPLPTGVNPETVTATRAPDN